MSEWDQWVAFVLGHAANNYFENAPSESPAVWHIQIGGHDGSVYAKSADFDGAFTQAEMAKMSTAANGDDSDIFTNPPAGYTIVRVVPATSEFNVVTGKKKKDSSRLLYVARATTTLVTALIDVHNTNRGCESKALDAFTFGMNEGINAGI